MHDDGWMAAFSDRLAAGLAKSATWRALVSDVRLLQTEINEQEQALVIAREHAEASQAALLTLRAIEEDVDAVRAGLPNLNHILTDWLWASNAPLPQHPRISVIMPTAFPDRLGYLRSAIESVLSQSYQNWELIVVDDGAVAFLDPRPDWWPTDDRVSVLRGEGRSKGLARNAARAVATGQIYAFLDDDCRWFPWWLHSVAHAFASDAELGLVYGVRIAEGHDGEPPWAFAQTLDPLTLQLTNPVDTNVMAHRAELPDSLWPAISSCADYDIVIRLSRHRSRFLPVPAATYAESSPNRTWALDRATINAANFRLVQGRAKRTRPLRIVAHNALYPLLSETYIGDELEALRRHHVDIVLSRRAAATVDTPSRIAAPLFESLGEAISHHDPDMVLVHWAGIGLESRTETTASGVPYGIRLHSFDGGYRAQDLINEWCVGIWTFPHFVEIHPRVTALDTLIVDPGPPGDDRRERRIVSLSAGLPKKDFVTFVDAMTRRPELPFDIVVATTNGFEALPTDVRKLIAEQGVNGTVIENLPFAAGQKALRDAGALVYSLAADQHIGQPRSVLEAAIARTPLVVPNHPAIVDLIGGCGHFFERGNPDSLAAAIDEALDRPRSLDERSALSQRVAARHAADDVFEAFANSITRAVVTWQRNARSDRVGANLRWWWPN